MPCPGQALPDEPAQNARALKVWIISCSCRPAQHSHALCANESVELLKQSFSMHVRPSFDGSSVFCCRSTTRGAGSKRKGETAYSRGIATQGVYLVELHCLTVPFGRSLFQCFSFFCCLYAEPDHQQLHYEIWKYCQSTSKVYALSTTESQSELGT